MSFLKKLASDSAIYGLNSILGRAINFLLVGVHTQAFEKPSDLEIIVILFSYVTFFNVIYTYGMETAFFRFADRKNEDFQKFYTLSLSSLLVSSTIFSLLLIVFATPITNFLGFPGKELLIIWIAIIIALDAIVAIPFARLRLENKAKKYVFIRILSVILNVFFTIFFLWFCKNIHEGKMFLYLKPIFAKLYSPSIGAGYIILANLLANLVYIPLLWEESLKKFQFYFDKENFLKMWNYGYPLLILGLAGMVNQQIDRTMLAKILPANFYQGLSIADVVGIYGSCYKYAMLISLATQSFRFAADPFFFSKAGDKNAPSVFAEVTKWFTIFCCILWVAISINLDFLGLYLGENYRVGLVVVPLLLLGNLLLGIYYNLAVWFKLTDKTIYGTWITLFGAAINILLNYLLIPKIGYMGCAWSFMISCLAMTVLCYLLGDKYFPVPYNLKTLLGYLVSSGLLIWLCSFVKIQSIWLSIGFHGIIFILFLLIILVVERERILSKPILRKLNNFF